jgi:hypothetical protein
VTGEDVYATDWPAAMALGDIKMLQVEEKRKAQGIDKMVNPPMKGPPGLAQRRISTLPGGMTVYEGNEQNKLEPLYNVRLPIYELRQDIEAIERRIDEIFFKDLLVGAGFEGVIQKFDADQAVDEYAKAIGVPPRIIRPDEVVAAERQQQQQQAMAQQAVQMGQGAAGIAKTASDTETGESENLLTDVRKSLSG